MDHGKWDEVVWVSPQGFFRISCGVPRLNVPKAAQPAVPPEEVDQLIARLKGLIEEFERFQSNKSRLIPGGKR